MHVLTTIVAALALVLNAALAGLFYGFSMSVLPGLGALPADQAEAAMRSINRKILNPWLYLTFFGAPIATVAAGALLVGSGQDLAATLLFAGAGVNVLGSFVPTVVVNVPMNNGLDAGREPWSTYAPRWTRWNTLRAVFCTISVLLVGAGLLAWN